MHGPLARLSLCLVLLAPLAAHAAEPTAQERASTLLQEGVQKRGEGKDEAALELFRQADALDSTPKSRAQMALAEQSLGLWVSAEQHLRDALAHADDPWIQKNKMLLDTSATRIAAELGWIVVLDAPAGAQVVVDGELVGQTPLETPLRAVAGSRVVEVKARGYETYARRITVRAGETTRERAVFVVAAGGDAGARKAEASGPRYVSVPVASPIRTAGWIVFGTGVAGLLLGGASLIVRQNYVDNYNQDERCPGTAAADQPQSCRSQQSGASRWGGIGIGSFIGGGVLAAGGILMVVLAPPSHTKLKVADAGSAACGLAGMGITCTGSF